MRRRDEEEIMNNEGTDKHDQRPETNALMAAYNPLPLQPAAPPSFYWDQSGDNPEPADDAVQAAFES